MSEHTEAIVACLGDDAAQLREESPEIADNMDSAALIIKRLERENAELRQELGLAQKRVEELIADRREHC